jgi:L-ribulokinase
MMQMYADVLQKPLSVSLCTQAPALGAAIMAASAAGEGDLFQAAKRMSNREMRLYTPNPDAAAAYDALYREYSTLHDYFGRGENRVMARLKEKNA